MSQLSQEKYREQKTNDISPEAWCGRLLAVLMAVVVAQWGVVLPDAWTPDSVEG